MLAEFVATHDRDAEAVEAGAVALAVDGVVAVGVCLAKAGPLVAKVFDMPVGDELGGAFDVASMLRVLFDCTLGDDLNLILIWNEGHGVTPMQ